MTNIWQVLNSASANIVDQVRASLVEIWSEDGGIGAGTIWHRDGLILTNAHVIVEQRTVRRDLRVVLQDGTQYAATVIAYDTQRDLAALSIDADDLPTVTIGNSRDLRPGQYLMALGHPWGIRNALTAGIMIGIGSEVTENPDGRDWIALDLKMRPGHSGGPLFDAEGRLVGINTMIQGPVVSFAVPVDVVKRFLQEVFAEREPAAAAASQAPEAQARTYEGPIVV